MTHQILSLGIDFIVLITLGVTIYFALRLSRALNTFRAHRNEFQKVLQELNVNIDRARKAVDHLKSTGNQAGQELQEYIDEAKVLSDEMRLINEAGNSLATRLETLAERNRRIAQGFEEPDLGEDDIYAAGPGGPAGEGGPFHAAGAGNGSYTEETAGESAPGFMIRDPEFEGTGRGLPEDSLIQDNDLQSQAEKELYEALRRNKKG